MKKAFNVTRSGVKNSDSTSSNLIIYEQATSTEREEFLQEYQLPADVFHFYDMPPVAPRIEYLKNTRLGETMIFVLANISEDPYGESVEKRLESHTFILGSDQLFWFINEGASSLDEELFDTEIEAIKTLESVIMSAGLLSYKHFTKELQKQKETIDDLENQAEHRTSKQVLINVADTERDMVMLEHTLDIQERAFSKLLNDNYFLERLADEKLTHDIKWYNRQVNKLVHLYRDLLDAVSALFSDIMSSSLNKLMKFLSSLSLILASSGLIAELWGMNTGGLPGEHSNYGTLILIIVAILAGLMMYLFLRNKRYFDD